MCLPMFLYGQKSHYTIGNTTGYAIGFDRFVCDQFHDSLTIAVRLLFNW